MNTAAADTHTENRSAQPRDRTVRGRHDATAGSRREWWSLAGFMALCIAAAALGGAATATSVDTWYPSLNKPAFNPPDAVFAPVWTLLFAAMGVAAWRVWQHRDEPMRRIAIGLFGVQMVLNVGWSLLFFGLRAPGAALIEVAVLWLAIAATIGTFARIDRRTAATSPR